MVRVCCASQEIDFQAAPLHSACCHTAVPDPARGRRHKGQLGLAQRWTSGTVPGQKVFC